TARAAPSGSPIPRPPTPSFRIASACSAPSRASSSSARSAERSEPCRASTRPPSCRRRHPGGGGDEGARGRARVTAAATDLACASCGRANSPDARFCAACGARLGRVVELSDEHDGGADPLLGRVIADRYRNERLLGRCGMGAVYRVEHVRIGKLMALKFLHGSLARDKALVMRFKREAEAGSKLDHPITVQVF